MQQYADIYLLSKLLYMFRVSQHPSSGVLKTLTAASGTGHNTGTATPIQRGLIGTGLCESTRLAQTSTDQTTQNCGKPLLASTICPFVCTEQLTSHETNCYEI